MKSKHLRAKLPELELPRVPAGYVTFEQIASCFAPHVRFTSKQFLDHGRKKDSRLKFSRMAGRYSPAVWRKSDLHVWARNVWRNAPEIAEAFSAKLDSIPANDFGDGA